MAKWIKGEQIKHPITVVDAILNGDMLFHNHKAQSPGWLQNWNIRMIANETKAGRFFRAIRNPQEQA